MRTADAATPYYIGWDVGGWNCDRNTKSRDAIAILNKSLSIVGTPWRGNLRESINQADNTEVWIHALFELCGVQKPEYNAPIYLAIDTPLGFPEALLQLSTTLTPVPTLAESNTNPYLFRATERYLFQQGLKPLSPIKDMIGSQATKGMHVLAKFAPNIEHCGVWTDGRTLTALEAYPSACKASATIQQLRNRFAPLGHEDKEDALTCALMAYLFAEQSHRLAKPHANITCREGWIWIPSDVVVHKAAAVGGQ